MDEVAVKKVRLSLKARNKDKKYENDVRAETEIKTCDPSEHRVRSFTDSETKSEPQVAALELSDKR